jgi:hypothetical protein
MMFATISLFHFPGMLFSFSLSFSFDLASIVLLAIDSERPNVPSLDLTGGGERSGVDVGGKADVGSMGVVVGDGKLGRSNLSGIGGGRLAGAARGVS